MTETTITETVNIEGLTVSAIVWKKFRRKPAGFVERILELNPGLSASAFVPVGTKITFPLESLSTEAVSSQVIRLWD